MLNYDLAPNGFIIVKSNPKNINEEDVAPPSDVTWAISSNDYGSATLQGGPLTPELRFQSNGVPGITLITMACAGKSAQVSVTVAAPVALPFDHFSPSFATA